MPVYFSQEQTSLRPSSTAELFLLHRVVAKYLDDPLLQESLYRTVVEVTDNTIPLQNVTYTGQRGQLLLTGLQRAAESLDADNDYDAAAAQMMLDEHRYEEARELNDLRVEYEIEKILASPPNPHAALVGLLAIENHVSFETQAEQQLAMIEAVAAPTAVLPPVER